MACQEGTVRSATGVAHGVAERRCAGEPRVRETGPGLRGPERCLDFLPCEKQDLSRLAENGWPGEEWKPEGS